MLSPGPGRIEVDLPELLGASMSAAAFVPTVPWSSAKWVGGHAWVAVCAMAAWAVLARGHGRRAAYALGVASAAGGIVELFVAGVAAGLGRPTEAWGMLVAGAAILLAIAGVLLPRIDRRFSTAELRKMRAMDVPA